MANKQSDFQIRFIGVLLFNIGVLLVASTRASYWDMKRALQYYMVGELAFVVHFVSMIPTLGSVIYPHVGLQIIQLIGNATVVYRLKPAEDVDEEEEDDDAE